MNCRFCGTALPADALFCGECGRAATAPVEPRRVPTPPAIPVVAFSSQPDAEPHAAAVVEREFICPQCGEPISSEDVFCGECGFVLVSSSSSSAGQRDTAAVPSFAPEASDRVVEEAALVPQQEEEPERDAGVADPEPVPEPAAEPAPGPETKPDAGSPLRSIPDPFPWGVAERAGAMDLEATRVVASASARERFVLQFSTGESVTVSGAGLVGRNPAAQPGEFVDQLVAIFDAGKSVSKTHLEFGQDGGRFWVSDRYSTNGSTVRQPDAEARRCEPGKRYFVARGTRVDIGEQFFVVS